MTVTASIRPRVSTTTCRLRPVDEFAAVETAAVRTDDRVRLDGLRVDHAGHGLFTPALPPPQPGTQPVVELLDQPVVAPAAEERIHPVPRREVHGRRPPLDAVVDQVADRVKERPVAVCLRLPAPARHRQQWPDAVPLRVRHVRGIPPTTLRTIGRVSETVSDTITRRSSRVGLHRHERVHIRKQGLLVQLLASTTTELPRSPVSMPTARGDHPIETPVRPTHLKIAMTTVTESRGAPGEPPESGARGR